jgi:hypothetical protein
MTIIKQNNMAGGVDTAVTVANSDDHAAGDAFNNVVTSDSGLVTYDSTGGQPAVLCRTTPDSPGTIHPRGTAYFSWNFDSPLAFGGRIELLIPHPSPAYALGEDGDPPPLSYALGMHAPLQFTLSNGDTFILIITGETADAIKAITTEGYPATDSGSGYWWQPGTVQLNGPGHGSGDARTHYSMARLPFGTWCRIEWTIATNPTTHALSYDLRVYADLTTLTPLITFNGVYTMPGNYGLTRLDFGQNEGLCNTDLFYANFIVTDGALPGPASHPTPTTLPPPSTSDTFDRNNDSIASTTATAVTVANSAGTAGGSGDAFDLVQTISSSGAVSALNYDVKDDIPAIRVECLHTHTVLPDRAVFGWSHRPGPRICGRMELYFEAFDDGVFYFDDGFGPRPGSTLWQITTSAGAVLATLTIDGDGKLHLFGTDDPRPQMTHVAAPTSTWFRIEWDLNCFDLLGHYEIRVFADLVTTTHLDMTFGNLVGWINHGDNAGIQFGMWGAFHAAKYWVGDVEINQRGFPGPFKRPVEPPINGGDWRDPTLIDLVAPAWTAGSGILLDIIREFSGQVRRPVVLTSPYSIAMWNINTASPIPQSASPDMYHSIKHSIVAGRETLSLQDSDLALGAEAELATNDVRVVTSGWRLPQQLPVYGFRPAPVRRVTFTFTPDSFTGSVDFFFPQPLTIVRRS